MWKRWTEAQLEFHSAVCHYKSARLCVLEYVCAWIYSIIYRGALSVCAHHRSAVWAFVLLHVCTVFFFYSVCSASVLKTEETTWFQPPVGLVAFEEMKCRLSSTHTAALICCPLKIHTHTHKHKSHAASEILFKGPFKIAKCPDNSSVLIESFFGEQTS